MTREELEDALRKLENYIEVQKLFISKPLCSCLVELQETFKETNTHMLNEFLDMQDLLLNLQTKDDEALKTIAYASIDEKIKVY